MGKYVAFLRGINVGGRNSIKMQELRDVLSADGFSEVSTYLQSGNVLLNSASNQRDTSDRIERLIREHWNFDIKVLARSKSFFKSVRENNPFQSTDASKIGVTVMSKKIAADVVQSTVEPVARTAEKVVSHRDTLYLYLPEGFAKTKITNNFLEKKLGVVATTRNWNTISKLADML